MKFFEKIFKKKSLAKTVEQMPQVEDDQKIRVYRALLEMEKCVFSPIDLLEPLGIAIVMDTLDVFISSIDKIKLYDMYDAKEDSFLGSFYAVEHNGKYYGNIVGRRQIISCNPNAFRFVETQDVIVPLQNDGKNVFVMVCRYVRKSRRFTVEHLEKKDISTRKAEILRRFDTGTTFSEAFSIWEKEFLKK